MDWISCPESSTIARFAYDGDGQRLLVEFHSGSTYEYFDVPTHVFEAMCAAGSKGQFLAQNVKGTYRYARL